MLSTPQGTNKDLEPETDRINAATSENFLVTMSRASGRWGEAEQGSPRLEATASKTPPSSLMVGIQRKTERKKP